MKNSPIFIPLAILCLGTAPATLALAGCGSPPDDTVVVNRAPEITPAHLAPAASPSPAALQPIALSAGSTKRGGVAPKVDSRYRVLGPDSAGYIPEVEKVRVPPPPLDLRVPARATVKFITSKGNFTVQLNPKEAPLHSKSFYYLARRGFYNGTVFHRYQDLTGNGGFIVQGGDPLTRVPGIAKEMYGQGGPGYEIPREHNKLTHQKLVIAAARTDDPDSAGSQFYFTSSEINFLDTAGGGYTVFGKVIKGGEVAVKLRVGDTIKKLIVG